MIINDAEGGYTGRFGRVDTLTHGYSVHCTHVHRSHVRIFRRLRFLVIVKTSNLIFLLANGTGTLRLRAFSSTYSTVDESIRTVLHPSIALLENYRTPISYKLYLLVIS